MCRITQDGNISSAIMTSECMDLKQVILAMEKHIGDMLPTEGDNVWRTIYAQGESSFRFKLDMPRNDPSKIYELKVVDYREDAGAPQIKTINTIKEYNDLFCWGERAQLKVTILFDRYDDGGTEGKYMNLRLRLHEVQIYPGERQERGGFRFGE